MCSATRAATLIFQTEASHRVINNTIIFALNVKFSSSNGVKVSKLYLKKKRDSRSNCYACLIKFNKRLIGTKE